MKVNRGSSITAAVTAVSPASSPAHDLSSTSTLFAGDDAEESDSALASFVAVEEHIVAERGAIGTGANSCVLKAFDKRTGSSIAIKCAKAQTLAGDRLKSESKILRQLRHANVIRYVRFRKVQDTLCLHLEYMAGGSLKNLVASTITEATARKVIAQLLLALDYLDQRGIIHCDIKAQNILLDTQGNIRLADFGSAVFRGKEARGTAGNTAGSPFWMAPELVRGEAATTACDIWSLGATLLEMLTKSPPFLEAGPLPAMVLIAGLRSGTNGLLPCPVALPTSFSPVLKDFLSLCFQPEPAMRPTARELLQHPWIANCVK